MKAVIFAGGLGTRLSEETAIRPKPLVDVGHRPILWHIMKIYSAHGINDFIVCCGHKGHLIKQYFIDYRMVHADVTMDMPRGRGRDIENGDTEPWRIVLVGHGDETMTGGRLKRVAKYLGDETFCLTYGDGVSNVDMTRLDRIPQAARQVLHDDGGTAARRWGVLTSRERRCRTAFREKPQGDDAWVNGGFFVCEPQVLDYIEGDATVWEREPMTNLARDGQLVAYRHPGFWQPMDTLRDKNVLEELWASGNAPWKIWQ